METKLFSFEIQNDAVAAIKQIILNNGYRLSAKEDYFSCVNYASFVDCVIISKYYKDILTPTMNGKVQILISYKDPNPLDNTYRNFSIRVVTVDTNAIHEVMDEINNIERILYNKLIDVVGTKNVIRERQQD